MFYSGNKVSVNDKDFLENEQSAFQEVAKMLKKWELPVNIETVRLHNEYSPAECPHRSIELYAGYNSSQRASESVVNKPKDYFISQIKAYYSGEILIKEILNQAQTVLQILEIQIGNQYGTW